METGPFKSCTGFEALFVQFVCEHASVITPQVHQMLNEKVAGAAFFLFWGGGSHSRVLVYIQVQHDPPFWQLLSHFGDFRSGVCRNMKMAVAESSPGIGV